MCLHQARRLGLCQQAPPRAKAILGTSDPAQISSTGCATTRNPEMHRLAHVSTLLRSVGTEFKVMQELFRHSTLRSTLDVYTQAITPAKRAAQAAVLSLVFSREANGTSRSS